MKQWKPTDDDEENQIFSRRVSPCGKMFIGIYPVLFGKRIRAGYVGSDFVIIDWCCGSDQEYLKIAYSILLGYMQNGGKFSDLPGSSNIKPWYNDPEFCKEVGRQVMNLKTTKTKKPEQ